MSVTLAGARCDKANFQNADLSNSYIASTDFYNANLCGANFSTCIGINEARFEGASYNSKTKWPIGFDPKRKGAIRNKAIISSNLHTQNQKQCYGRLQNLTKQ